MECILAAPADLDALCAITAQAKAQLAGLGLDQWQAGYPNRDVWAEDIRAGRAWTAREGGRVAGAFAYFEDPQADYAVIEDGAWLTAGPYASVHRVCVADGLKGRGIAPWMFARAADMARASGMKSLRIDTHPGNLPMQRAIAKGGFRRCGVVRIASGPEAGHVRWAYELIL